MGWMTGMRRTAVLVLAASALAGCSTTDTLDSMLVDPSRYEGYNCKDLGNQLQTLNKREKDLRNLIDRADESASGVVIGAFALPAPTTRRSLRIRNFCSARWWRRSASSRHL